MAKKTEKYVKKWEMLLLTNNLYMHLQIEITKFSSLVKEMQKL